MKIGKRLIFIGLGLLSAQQTLAQQEQSRIDGGRPDQTQGTSIVPEKMIQIESGVRLQKNTRNNHNVYTHAYPDLTLRLGLLDWLELRFTGAIQDSVIQGQDNRRISGTSPLAIGTRVYLWPAKGWFPEAALTGQVTVPVGNNDLQPDNTKTQLRLGLSNQLTRTVSLSYSLSYGWVPQETEKAYAANLVFKLSEKFDFYGEVFGNKQERAQAEHQADIGLLFYPKNNMQLDVAAGLGLNQAAPDYFLTTGVSIRLPR